MTILAVARSAALRILRDRLALFFMIVLPVIVIVIVGAVTAGIDKIKIGVLVDDRGALSASLTDELRHNPSLSVKTFSSLDTGRTAVRRSEVQALVRIPSGTDAALRRGAAVEIPVFANNVTENAQAVQAAIGSTLSAHGARVQAAQFATTNVGGSLETNLDRADATAHAMPSVDVKNTAVDTKGHILPTGFNYSAPTMLVLFVFINSLAAGAAMIETRRLGVFSRAMAAPVTAGQIVLGEMLVYVSIALAQSALIIAVAALAFGVHWGNPLAAAALVGVWALVGAGAGMLVGTLFKTPEQSTSVAITSGILMGMLGGCMWPLEIVPSVMRTIGHVTPQAWAVDAWTILLSRSGTVTDIGRPLAVLAGFAVALVGLASRRLRRVLTS